MAEFHRVLVTGGAGFIGANFVRHAARAHPEWSIVVLDKLTYAGNRANLAGLEDRIEFRPGDIADQETVDDVMAGCDAVVNFAAESHVDRSLMDCRPFVRTNVEGVVTLLGAPARIARLIDRTLAARPRKRPQTATDLREGLEAVLGAVPPGECRAEIAAWLWGAGVFHVEDGATVALPQQPSVRKRRRRPLRSGWLAAAAAALGLVAGAASLNTLAYREADVAGVVGRVVDTLRPGEVLDSDPG